MEIAVAARRAVHCLLGAVVGLPYVAVAWLVVGTGAAAGPAVALALGVPAAVVGAGVLVLPGVRELATTAARTLLDVELPDPRGGGRLRAAAWLLLAVVAGAVGAAAVLWLVPTAVALLQAPWVLRSPLPTGAAAWWCPPAAVAAVLLAAAVPAGLGAVQARFAARVLGPTPAERLAAELDRERRRAEQRAVRDRLAGELHDSVGHALTVTTLQAGAAAELLDSDPAFVRRALAAIADTGRAALDDLDHVLGLLARDPDAVSVDPPGPAGHGGPGHTPGPAGSPGPAGTDRPAADLDDLGTLLAGVRAAGLDLGADVDDGPPVPGAVSREAYRLAREALTNALRHAGPGPVTLVLRHDGCELALTVTSPLGASVPRRDGGGRGLAGAAARVALLGGGFDAGPRGCSWVLHARLPVPGADTGTDDRRGGARAGDRRGRTDRNGSGGGEGER
nr:histidine kinase [Pseudonocardia sp. AL041005-10]